MARPKWLGGSGGGGRSASKGSLRTEGLLGGDAAGAAWDTKRLNQLLSEEKAEAERDKTQWQKDHLGLIRYIDPQLADEGLVMPPQLQPLIAVQFIAGAIEQKRQVAEMKHRRNLILAILWFSLVWLSVVLAIVLLDGFSTGGFHLDSGVLVALVTTTTANVLGLAFIILRGLFYKKYVDHTPSEDPKRP